MSYRSQSLIDTNRTRFSSGVSEVPKWFVATVDRRGSREIDQPTTSLTFWQSVLGRARPRPLQFSHTLLLMFLLWVQSVGAGAISSKVDSGSVRVQNRKPKLENSNPSDV